MMKIIIVDDEAAARRGLKIALSSYDDVEVIGEADGVNQARLLIDNLAPDVVLLDIEMSHLDGFSLSSELSSRTRIIFITAHSHYAHKAFEVGAVDYLLKPVVPKRLRQALDRASNSLVHRSLSQQFIVLREQQKEMKVDFSEILALKADGDYTRFILKGRSPALIARGLGCCFKELPVSIFFRLNRSLVVNLEYVEALECKSRDSSRLYLKGMKMPILLKRSGTERIRSILKR